MHPAATGGAAVAGRPTDGLVSALEVGGSHDVGDAEVDAVATTGDISASAGAAVDSPPAAEVDALDELAPMIDRARIFAERWDVPYRPEIFRVALGHLLGGVPTTAPVGAQRARLRGAAEGPASGGEAVGVGGVPRASTTEKLARQLNVDPDAVERAVQFEDGGKVSIMGRIEGKTRRELQIKYGLALLYVKEIALATRLVEIDELRAVCVRHGCYDQNNFTGNFKKAVQEGVMREQATEKGARVRRYMLTQKGMNEAAALLRDMVLQ